MAATVFEKILLLGTQASYDALSTKDTNKLYFTSDTRQLYKGADLYTEALRVVTVRPAAPAQGVIYLVGGKTLEYWNGSAWVVIVPEIIKTLVDRDDALPTSKAVKSYVDKAIEDLTAGGDVVQSVEAGTADATLSVTTGGVAGDVVVPGVVTTPSYDASTRTITLPVSGKESLVIALGKDIFVDPNADNKYNPATKNIELYLNDASGNPTKIEIPAQGLIDVYTGAATPTATVTVSDTNVISVAVKLSSDSKNALTVDGENGLILDLTDVNAAIAAAQAQADKGVNDAAAAQADADTANAAIAVLNGDTTVEGSVKKQIATAKTELEGKIATAQAQADKGVADAAAAQAAADAAQEAVDGVIAGIGWGTF